MTKKEILKIIESKELILDNEEILQITKTRFGNNISEDNWFYKIDDLKEEFETLKKELRDVVISVQNAENELSNLKNIDCKHEVRLAYKAGFVNSSECVFCGKHIDGDNLGCANTIYKDINRNKKCVMFAGTFDDGWSYCSGYSLKYVFNIIKDILKDKNDNEEINFIEEFKKLDIEDCKIDEREYEKEYYVLIIGGSNKYYINDTHYIVGKSLSDSSYITHYLCGIPKVNVELFENKDTYDSKKFTENFPYTNISRTRFDKYETLEELKKIIEEEKHVPFDLIIDVSSLFEYQDNNITEYNLDLKELFPNSYIINISKYDLNSEKEFLNHLKQKLLTYNNAYIQTNKNKYHSIENEGIKESNLEETCDGIKKILLKK